MTPLIAVRPGKAVPVGVMFPGLKSILDYASGRISDSQVIERLEECSTYFENCRLCPVRDLCQRLHDKAVDSRYSKWKGN